MGAFEDGSTFLAGVLAKLPDAERAQAKTLFESTGAKDAVTLLGDGVLARSDYSKRMDALKVAETQAQAQLENLNSWYEVNKTALEEYKAIKPKFDVLSKGGTPPEPLEPEPLDPRAAALEVVNEAGREYVNVAAWLADKAFEHWQLFGERLNTQALTAHPKLGKPIAGQPGRVVSLPDVYQEQFGERVAQKHKETEEKRITTEVEKRLAEERAKHVTQPFPLRGDPPSVLDVLSTKEGSAPFTVDAAIAEYQRLQESRQPV